MREMALNGLAGIAKGAAGPKVSAQQFDDLPSKGITLPTIARLARVASLPCGVLFALSLATAHWFFGVGIAGGLLVALVMYAGIHTFVNGASSLALATVGGKANPASGSFMPMFALVAVGKFIALGVLLYVLFRVAHIGLVAFAVGFLTAQISITVECIRSLARKPIIEKADQAQV